MNRKLLSLGLTCALSPTILCAQDNGTTTPTEKDAPQQGSSAHLVRFATGKIKLAREQRMRYLEAVDKGEIDPSQAFDKIYKQDFPKALPGIKSAQQAIINEPNEVRKKALCRDLQRVLEPLGPFLEYAEYRTVEKKLGKSSMQEEQMLGEIDVSDQPDPNSPNLLKVTGGSDYYTLLSVPVFLDVEGPAHAWVYLAAGGGGEFSNGLVNQRLKTDGKGRASTYWVSHGDSIGANRLLIASPAAKNKVSIHVDVLGLQLKALAKEPLRAAEQQIKSPKVKDSLKK